VRIAYLGPAGTYSEEAALQHARQDAAHFGESPSLVPFASIPAAVRAVEEGAADEAVVPVENSLEGVVTHTADLLIHHTPLKIRREIVLPIHHCLVLQSGVDRRDVQVVYSHPQALAQCRGYLEHHLPGAEPVASLSTASAVRLVMGVLAVASHRVDAVSDSHRLPLSDQPDGHDFVAGT